MSSSSDPMHGILRELSRAPAMPIDGLRPGGKIGRFELLRELGRGGFGVVWEARDPELGRHVAIKGVRAERLVRGFDVAAFRREAAIVASLSHPGIVTLHDVIIEGEQPYLVLECLRGETLETRLARDLCDARELAELAIALARALAHAHAAGVLHLDLKPSNVFCTDDGGVKILDFGLAALADARHAGTPGYMAPEQWRGETCDARSDLFALGATLVRACIGQLPYGDGDPSGRALAPMPAERIPGELATLIQRTLALAPGDRPASAGELASAFSTARERLGDRRDATENPYRYLEAFRERDEDWFFGRDREANRLRRMVDAHPIVAIVGASGAGKSSLIAAGLVPRLVRHGTWHVVRVRGGGDLASQLAAWVPEAPAAPAALATAVREHATRTQTRVLIVVDQLEELFTRPGEREPFAELLVACADDASSPVRVVAAIREDFLGRLAELPALAEPVSQHLMLLGPPDKDALAEAVRGPARRAGISVDDEVIAGLVAGVAGELSPLPTLQVAASRLWERRDGAYIGPAQLRELGGVPGVLATHAEEVVRGLGPDELAAAQRVLRVLVTADHTRIARERSALLAAGGTAHVLDVLVRGRLLTIGTTDGREVLELAHESLITRWARLAEWLANDASALRWRDRLAQAAAIWRERGRPVDLLWRGELLAEARVVLADRTLAPAADLVFLDGSVRRATRGQRLRRALTMAAIAASAVAIAVAFVQVRASHREARRARVAALVQTAAAARDPLVGVLLLGELPADAEPGAVLAAASELSQRPIPVAVLRGHAGPIVRLSFAGDTLVTAGGDGTLRTWPSKGPPIVRDVRSPIESVAVAGGEVLTATDDGVLRAWPLAGGGAHTLGTTRPLALVATIPGTRDAITIDDQGGLLRWSLDGGAPHPLDAPKAATEELAVSADGHWLAYAAERDVIVVDLTGARPAQRLAGHEGFVWSLAFGGDRLVTCSDDRTVRVWSLAMPAVDPIVLRGHEATCYRVAVTSDGARIASVAHDGTARLWAVDAPASPRVLELETDPTDLAFSPDGARIAVGSRTGTVFVWSVARVEPPVRLVGDGTQMLLAFDGDELAAAGSSGEVRRWKLATDPHVLRGHDHIVRDVAFRGDSAVLATASVDGKVALWRVPDGSALGTLVDGKPVTSVAFTGDDVVTAADDGISRWHGGVRTPLPDLHGDRVLVDARGEIRPQPLPDGVSAEATANGLTARLVDSRVTVLDARGREQWAQAVPSALALAVAPDGTVAVGTANHIELLHPGRATVELTGHTGSVVSLAFSPDGRWLASGSNDRTARLWSLDWHALRAELLARTTACLATQDRERYLGERSDVATARYAACERSHGR